jgi:hypothetical protein
MPDHSAGREIRKRKFRASGSNGFGQQFLGLLDGGRGELAIHLLRAVQQGFMSAVKLARFELPNRLVRNEETATDTYAQFIAEPFERGYGHTIGNSLRRVLLSSLEGAAITSVRIAGVQHEFSSLPGVVEDVTDIVLNLKKVKFATTTRNPASSPSRSRRKASSPPATSGATTSTTSSTRTRSSAPSTRR